MRCEKCIEQGLKSTIIIFPGSTTLMWSTPYYDEKGRLHDHNPNWSTTDYRCSNGHEWRVRSRTGCAICGDEGEKEIMWR